MAKLVPILFMLVLGACANIPNGCDHVDYSAVRSPLSSGALMFSLTISEAARKETVDGIPFKYVSKEWENLKKKVTDNSKLWYFSERFETMTGYVLIENCSATEQVILKLNMM